MNKKIFFLFWGVSAAMLLGTIAHAESESKLIKRGQYLVSTSGCNDCHTPGYGQADGKLPASHGGNSSRTALFWNNVLFPSRCPGGTARG